MEDVGVVEDEDEEDEDEEDEDEEEEEEEEEIDLYDFTGYPFAMEVVNGEIIHSI